MSAGRIKKRYMNLMSVIVFVSCLLLLSSNAVFAVPYLQLDAFPSGYDEGEESVVTTGPVFTLYALVDSTNSAFVEGGIYWISVAIIPDPGAPVDGKDPLELGSYDFNKTTSSTTTYNVVDGMDYGVPPLDAYLDAYLKDKNLPGHGVYDTYYREHKFTLEPTGYADLYNSQDNFGGLEGGLIPNDSGPLYYQAFLVDATGLEAGSFLHFDFYTKDGLVVDKFAPFSHDVTHTPVPGAVLLGILGLGVAGVKLRKFA